MKYRLEVNVRITSEQSYNPLTLSESKEIELTTLSDAANILVKLHEFFEALRNAKTHQ